MRRLTTIFSRNRRGDRGAVTALVAILLTGGVLLGMGALVVDVGRIYAEREELLTGADAAAWAVANQCAVSLSPCSAYTASAQSYANLNASDGAVTVSLVCGLNPKISSASTCPAENTSSTSLSRCIGTRAAAIAAAGSGAVGYVEVYTSTKNPDGSTLLPPVFARALAGGANNNGTPVGACSRVTWNTPTTVGPVSSIAAAVTACVYNGLTTNGTNYPTTVKPIHILGDNAAHTGCPAPTLLGTRTGFGWLDSSDCTRNLTYPSDTAGGTAGVLSALLFTNCTTVLNNAISSGTPVNLPIYDTITGGSAHLIGYAPFVVTGWRLTAVLGLLPQTRSEPATGACTGFEQCIYGYFKPLPRSVPGSYGVTTLKRAG
ncbi:pilus assembly protein TadG-related protein [Catenuloplanes indicus]|uniref:Flp pilus assembly protein TadG n=1 Tax=Catenuloplanes indicus TaxID=137267 RepID=A0AAE4AZS3_9ACTN|nr:pilus assembly protein TadG-related protein [Catenuloplanes indicus]MDQ0368764.1 Flp pilus assembly protein TadG [Catenuloplanes indicus]